MRGEDASEGFCGTNGNGSPPHARGRPPKARSRTDGIRITPACAGKTAEGPVSDGWDQDHPRMRGEDQTELGRKIWGYGSPPHARGRP